MRAVRLCIGRRHARFACHLPGAGRPAGGRRFGKHVYHTESTLDLDDGLGMGVIVPF
jgi:hypothetical protein